ncbi:hypothetical protein ACQI5H_20220 [Mycobacterium heidelbergense]|uniref:hypothetical protein n=1 Tax=Mycobacterium heidelbergense TaxID=53376 RepID=UPI003CEADE91
MGTLNVIDLEVNYDLLGLPAADLSALRDLAHSILDDLPFEFASRGTTWQHGGLRLRASDTRCIIVA